MDYFIAVYVFRVIVVDLFSQYQQKWVTLCTDIEIVDQLSIL